MAGEEPVEAATSDDLLDSPTLLERAADSRSLIADLYAVVAAFAEKKEGTQDEDAVEETVAASPPEASVTAEPSTPDSDDQSLAEAPRAVDPVNQDAPEGGESVEEEEDPLPAGDDDPLSDDLLALVTNAGGALVTVEDDLDELLTVRGTKEIHQLLRDLSSTR